ncbi:MAG: DUF192 domain-containing protein [Candidatus Omnitrophota bacterium]
MTKIVNKTKNIILAEKTEIADTPLKRMKGLLGKNNLNQGEGLIIKPCSSIHTFFMRFSIDVVFLDDYNEVTALTESLPPFRFFGSFLKGKIVLELPQGTIARTKTSINDKIEIQVD